MNSIPKASNLQHLIAVIIVCTLLGSCSSDDSSNFLLPDTVDFNYHIRPILSQNCYLCHGPDPSSREADLRLDTYEGATSITDNGKVIAPHHSSKSILIDRIQSGDPDFQMPPPESKKNLTKKEIALIEKWIDQGAEWKEHWAYIKPNVAPTHKAKFTRISGGIDFFINKELDYQKLESSDTADIHQLIRRVSYLTTGLPPTLTEIKRFSDPSTTSYDSLVDYYLDSPHYGERWARHWMDLVRYAEHRGHEFDFTINGAYHYRDYLIRAFNKDVPYDLFVKEHLAGDMLVSPRLHPEKGFNESVIATIYANLGEGKHSPVSIKEEEASRIDNMIDVTSKTFQALTVSCSRCHDHKFDPIPTSDYYAMYGMFESTRLGPTALVNTTQSSKISEEILKFKESAKNILEKQLIENASSLSIVEVLEIQHFIASQNESLDSGHLEVLADFTNGQWNEWKSEGIAFGNQSLSNNISIDLNPNQLEFIPPSASSRSISKGLVGSIRSPNFDIVHDNIGVYARGLNSSIRIIVDNFHLIQNPLYGSLSKDVNSKEFQYYELDVSMLKGHKAYIEILPGTYKRHIYSIDSSAYVEVQYAFSYDQEKIKSEIFPPIQDHKIVISKAQVIESIKAWKNNNATPKDIEIANASLLHSKKGKGYYDRLNSIASQIDKKTKQLQNASIIHTMSEGDAVLSPVFIRGSYKELGPEKVAHGFLSAPQMHTLQFPSEGSGRLAWAEAVVHPENPLTARVIVNRVWHHIFGKGIVASVDNFGLQGTLPTHPELLDFLAVSFVEQGWSIKNLIREILISETFRKSSIPIEQNEGLDPENNFLHYFPIRRLEAEAIRDGILASSNELKDTMYGEPVDLHLTSFMTGRGRPKVSGPLDGEGRRSIYTSIRRNFLPPFMLTFDMPIPFSAFGKRNITNVPAQSLALMNDPFVHQQALKWAEKIVEEKSTDISDRIDSIYLTAFARHPTEYESKEAIQLLEVLANGKLSKQEMRNDLELWTQFCHSIYNLKEFIHLM